MPLRVGIGYDSHRLVDGERLVIGGVEIDHDRGLAGHSDADVLTHAVIDALLGACGLGDVGELFPDSEEQWSDANSIDLLRIVIGRMSGAVANVDVTVICEEPKLAPYKAEISSLLTGVLSAPVSVKASTNEGMGAIGRGEGIACMAVALVDTGDEISARLPITSVRDGAGPAERGARWHRLTAAGGARRRRIRAADLQRRRADPPDAPRQARAGRRALRPPGRLPGPRLRRQRDHGAGPHRDHRRGRQPDLGANPPPLERAGARAPRRGGGWRATASRSCAATTVTSSRRRWRARSWVRSRST